MSIHITEAARLRMQSFLESRPEAKGVRFGVRKTGCSGYAYAIDLTDEIDPDDHVFVDQGVTLVVDPKSLDLVDGTEIDFARQGMNAAFVFHNPKVTGECGCGESFTISTEYS